MDSTELLACLESAMPSDCRGWQADGRDWDGQGYEIAVWCVEPTPWERVHDLLRYLWVGPLSGEWDDQTPKIIVADRLFVFQLDTTKSGRDDVIDVWDSVKQQLADGTPVRKTDKAGPGTKGTRKYQGVGPVLIAWR
jgi:hypothetical protein